MNTTNDHAESLRALAMLRYKATRFQAMGNGTMSQRILAEIRRKTLDMGITAAQR